MEKRKFKINILDFVIFVVILCSVAILVFRDTVNEVFIKPEATVVEITLSVDGTEQTAAIRSAMNEDVVFIPDVKKESELAARFTRFNAAPGLSEAPQSVEVSIKVSGYKRLGRFYTEDGTRLYSDTECAVIIGDVRVVGRLLTVEVIG